MVLKSTQKYLRRCSVNRQDASNLHCDLRRMKPLRGYVDKYATAPIR